MPTRPRYFRINTNRSLIRDSFQMGIINTDKSALAAAIRRKEDALRRLSKKQQETVELNNLRMDVAELKELVLKLLSSKEEK